MRRHLPTPIVYLIFIIVFSSFITSCSQRSSSNETLIMAMEQSLKSSDDFIKRNKSAAMRSLLKKSIDYATRDRTAIWLSKAEWIQQLSADVHNYLQGLKQTEEFSIADARGIVSTLIKYRNAVSNIDSLIQYGFAEYLPSFLNQLDSSENGNKHFFATFLNKPAYFTNATLTKIQYDISMVENKIMEFCDNQIGPIDDWHSFTSYTAIIGQNSDIITPGGELTINAGMGIYSRAAQPKIQINGMLLRLNEEGFVTYKLKASDEPGEYKVPVSISFFNETTGKEEKKSVEVGYRIVKLCDQ